MDYEVLLDTILKYSNEGMMIVDKDAKILFYNRYVGLIDGISDNIAIGKNVMDIYPDMTPDTSTFYYVLRTGKALVNHDFTYTNYLGKSVSLKTSTIPLLKEGEIIGAVEILTNLTDKKDLSDRIMSLQNELYFKKNKKKTLDNDTKYEFDDIIGESDLIYDLKEKSRKIANSNSPILIYGETGTGKELLVQSIHNVSIKRRNKPFIAQNCAAIPHNLLESILFGTSAGSFTGAKDKPGLFELADGGTLFLDEINSMDIEVQSKLLRTLQDGVVRRVGGNKTCKVDVRIIAAINEKPSYLVDNKILREDLYYRLNVIYFELPPLRDRREDIPILIDYFIKLYNEELLKKIKGVSESAMEAIMNYEWPGNIRQLKYAIESAMNFMDGEIIQLNDLPSVIKSLNMTNGISEKKIDNRIRKIEGIESLSQAIDKYEIELLYEAIEEANGNYAKAARLLKIPKQTFYNKVKKHKIKKIFALKS